MNQMGTGESRADGGAMLTTNATMWPVSWQKPVEAKQAALGMQVAAGVLGGLTPAAQFSVAIQAGGGEPVSAWIGVETVDDQDFEVGQLILSTLRSLVPWLGLNLDEPMTALPRLDAAVGPHLHL